MSGAEVLFGIGLLCNAMQIVTFGRDALQVAKTVKNCSSPDPLLDQYIANARRAYEDMSASNRQSPNLLSRDEQQIHDIGKECEKSLEKLSKRLGELSVPKDRQGLGRVMSSLTKGVKTLWSGNLDSLERDLDRHENLLRTRLLSRVCS